MKESEQDKVMSDRGQQRKDRIFPVIWKDRATPFLDWFNEVIEKKKAGGKSQSNNEVETGQQEKKESNKYPESKQEQNVQTPKSDMAPREGDGECNK